MSREEGTPQPGEQYQHKSCSELSQPCEWPEGVGGCGSPEKCRRRVKGPTIAAPGPSAVQPEDIGFLDWNTLTMDQLTEHLTREFSMHSSGTAFAVMKMIAEVTRLRKINEGLDNLLSITSEEAQDRVNELQSQLAAKEKLYNNLGVKYDKELERWQERDMNELNKRKELESTTKALLDAAEEIVDLFDEGFPMDYGHPAVTRLEDAIKKYTEPGAPPTEG